MGNELDWKEQTLEGNGLRLRESGTGDVVLVFLARAETAVNPVLQKLAKSHRIVCFDPIEGNQVSANEITENLRNSLNKLGIGNYGVIGIQAGALAAIALASAAPERIDRLILLSPVLAGGADLLDLAAVKAVSLVLAGTRDDAPAIEAARLCREKIPSCHLSFVYDTVDTSPGGRLQACLSPLVQFLQEGEQFIIVRESQRIR